METKLFIILTISISIILSNNAFAKCQLALYLLSGEIKETCPEKAIPNVKLYIFFDEQENSHPGEYQTTTSYSAISDNAGGYIAKNYFSKYSGWSFSGDECDYEPKTIEVVVVHEDYYSSKTKYKVEELKLLEEKEDIKSYALPPIVLNALKK
jgi:hypothetical protein